MHGTPAGWYPDPTGRVGVERYFDGAAWSDDVRHVTVSFGPRPTAPAVSVGAGAPAAGPSTAPEGARPAPSAWTSRQPVPQQPHRHDQGPGEPSAALPSLLDGIAYGPAAGTAQGMLRGTAADAVPRALRVTGKVTPSGWYPDPARSGRLRFFDGKQWTARTRVPVDGRKRKLPAAAVALRARLLELADDQAVRGSGRRPQVRRIVVSAASPTPSLNLATRSRSGAVVGMLSMLMIVGGLTAAVVVAWQLWGSGVYTDLRQGELDRQLAEQAEQYGNYTPFEVTGDDPAPVVLPTPAPTAAPTHTTSSSQPPAKTKPAKASPELNSQPADITPWPPTGWTPPSNRSTPAMPTGDGTAVGRLIIPRMGVDHAFVAGTSVDALRKGPGLWKWGAFPGTPGNATISGHRTTYGAPFHDMAKLKYGDQIIVEVPGQPRAVFEVRGRVIASPFDVQVTRNSPGVRLTLTTCHPIGSAAERMVVQAELVQGAWLDKAVNRSQWKVLR